jgi:hypothetical protein
MQLFAYSDLGCKMIQCKDCELCEAGPDGRRIFKCDPFSNIKEPDCLAKWQLIRLDMLVASYQGMLQWNKELAPLQDKILKYMRREIEDMEDSESWKLEDDQEEQPPEDL